MVFENIHGDTCQVPYVSWDAVVETYTIVGEGVVYVGLQSFKGGVCTPYITQPTLSVPVLLHPHISYKAFQDRPNINCYVLLSSSLHGLENGMGMEHCNTKVYVSR